MEGTLNSVYRTSVLLHDHHQRSVSEVTTTQINIISPPNTCSAVSDSCNQMAANKAPNRGSLPISNETRVGDVFLTE